MKKIFCIVFSLFLLAAPLISQEALQSYEEDYYDFLSLQGTVIRPTLGYRTLSDSVWHVADTADHVWQNNNLGSFMTLFSADNPASNFFLDGIPQSVKLRIYGPEWVNSYNTAFPYGQNDGALWQGAGYNTSLSTGVRLEGFGFELTFKPQLVFSENNDWDYIPGYYDQYSYFTPQHIDLVQRYGEDSFYNYSWGDSEIRWTWHTFTVGYGTQSPWLGSSWLNPMLGSNNADPYLKFDAGIRKTPLIIPGLGYNLGDIEARVWLGRLKQSDYYSETIRNTDRMISMGSFSYAPSFINGLTVGLNRLFVTYWSKENLSYMLRLFDFRHKNGSGSGNDEDQKAALYVDWLFPEAGFEVYGELGIDDFTCYEMANPFHTGIYTIGTKQIIPISSAVKGMLNLEWNCFEMSQDFQLQWPYGGFYYHGFVNQGFTSNGQIIGAGTGYMGNSQCIDFSIYYPKGKTSFLCQRYCNNNNYILNKAVYDTAYNPEIRDIYAQYETYLTFDITTDYYVTSCFSINGGTAAVFRYFPKYAGDEWDFQTSFNFNVGLKYNF